MTDLYKQDGVDIDAGDFFSKFAGNIARSTYTNSPYVEVHDLSRGNFRGPRGYVLKDLPEGYLETGSMDGIGTKTVLIDTSRNYLSAATNLVSMCAMDITRYGGLPLIFMNIFDVRSLGEIGSERFKSCQLLMLGLKQVMMRENYVLFTGETAELGLNVGSENPDAQVMFNWGGAMFGVYHPDKMIRGDTLAPGQIVIALKEKFRSNGISSARKALAIKYGNQWWNNPEALEDILDAASPSVLYDSMLNAAHGWFVSDFKPIFKMHLIVHLSGGAFESKLGKDVLRPLGLTAQLNDLFEPPGIMRKCAEWRGMSEEECYRTWNGGQGALVVLDKQDVSKFLKFADSYGVDAKPVGKITRYKGYSVSINSKFGQRKVITYE